MTRMNFKRGDTFSYFIELTDADNLPLVLPVEDIKCQIRTKSGSLIDSLIIETTATNGKYLVSASNTTHYPVGNQEMDLKINENGVFTSTETVEVVVEKDVTRWL
jgi:hypothetical protein